MRGFFGGGGRDPHAETFDAWLRAAMIDGATRDEALTRSAEAPGARDAQPHEDYLLPLMVAAGAASGEAGVVDFHGHALGKPISGFRFGCPLKPGVLPMSKLLVVETSPRGGQSISRGLTRRYVAAWQAAHPGGEVAIRDLMETDLQFIGAPRLQAYFTPAEQQSEAMRRELALSDEFVAELLACDHLVIATPVYNYNVPVALKAWIDSIVRKGLTLGFDGQGLVTGKSATVLMASGGVYTEGSPIRDRDIATQYLRLILKVIGITEVGFVAAGNAKSVDMGEIGRDAFLDRFQEEVVAQAA